MGKCFGGSGNKLAGNLNMMGYSNTSLADQNRLRDAVHKAHVDTQTLSKQGAKMLGGRQMNGRLSGNRQ